MRDKTWKQLKCPPTEEWIKKMRCVYTVKYYSAIQKNEILPFAATWMALEIFISRETKSEGSKSEREKCHVIPLVFRI